MRINASILLSILVLSTTLICCDKNNPNQYKIRNLELKNKLGELTILLPNTLDTLLQYEYISDTNCGDKYCFQFSGKKYNLMTREVILGNYESFIDSTYALLISQPKSTLCPASKNDRDYLKNEFELEKLSEGLTKFYIEEIKEINGRLFGIYYYENIWNHKKNIIIQATTRVNNHPLTFRFCCNASLDNDFVNKMNKSLLSIKIKTG